MQKILEILIKLQDIDQKLKHLTEEKGDLPQTVQSLKTSVSKNQEQLELKRSEKKEAESQKLSLKNDIELLEAKLKKYKVQLYQVKTNKEYDAITLEIESSSKEIDDKGYKGLELDEKMEILEGEIKEITRELNDLQSNLTVKKRDLDAKLEKTKEREEELQKAREKLVKNLPKPVLSTYHRIFHARGVAVSRLEDGACSECSSKIPPQRGLEIRMGNQLYFCEVCGRIVVWIPEEQKSMQKQAIS